MPAAAKTKPRSGCPVGISLDILGDRWSLLVIRDLMVRGFRTFGEFEKSGEGIATNILANRLRRLESAGILTAAGGQRDGRAVHYELTEKGIELAPLLFELLIWGGRYEQTGAPRSAIAKLAENREELLTEVRRRWRDKDRTPLLPKFEGFTQGEMK